MPSIDFAGRAGAVEFWQNGPIGLRVNARSGLIVILTLVVVAHCPLAGVKI